MDKSKKLTKFVGTAAMILAVGALSVGCRGAAEGVRDDSARTYSYEQDGMPFDSVAVLSSITIPQTDEGTFLGAIQRAIKCDSLYILVDDMKQVVGLDQSGRQRFVIHNIGQGPGEYSYLFDAAVDKKNSQLLLAADKKIVFYDLSGNYLNREIQLDDYAIELVVKDDVVYVVQSIDTNNILSKTTILTINLKDGVQHAYLKPLPQYAPFCTFEGSFLTLDSENNVVFTRMFDEKIYHLLPDSYECAAFMDYSQHWFVPEDGRQYECVELGRLARKEDKVYVAYNMIYGDKLTAISTNDSGIYVVDNSDKMRHVARLYNPMLRFGLVSPVPVLGGNGQFICAVDADLLISYAGMQDKADNPELQELVAQLTPDSNPVLFIYTLK